MCLTISDKVMAVKPPIPIRIRTGILSNIPNITGSGATKIMNIHLKKLIR